MVLEICNSESERRVGNCRLTLLEIVGRLAAARFAQATSDISSGDDLAPAFDKLYETLDLDPSRRRSYFQSWNQQVSALKNLSSQGSTAIGGAQGSELYETARRCIKVSSETKSYYSMMYMGTVDDERLSSDTGIVWGLEYAKPDRFRVTQNAGEDADEWVTIGQRHFRGPGFVHRKLTKEEDDFKTNESLLLDCYLRVMGNAEPISIEQFEFGSQRYCLLDYKTIEAREVLPWLQTAEVGLIQADFWVNSIDDHLVKVDLIVEFFEAQTADEQTGRLVHLFGNYDADILVVPPAFQLIE